MRNCRDVLRYCGRTADRLPHLRQRSGHSQSTLFSSMPGTSGLRYRDGPVKVVVVGSGRMGKIRSGLIYANPKFELVGIVDTDLDAAQSLASSYHVDAFGSLDEILTSDKDQLDGVVCSSPTCTHASVVEQVIDCKISHVFLEKPIEETAQKIEALFEKASKHELQLCCGFQRRFDSSYRSALTQLPSIGKVIYADIFFGDHPVPPMEFLLKGGDIFMDLSAHDVDFVLQALKGQSVLSVYATRTSSSSELKEMGVHDNATLVLNCSDGAVVNLFLSRSANYGYDQRCEFFGTEGRIQVQNIHETSTVISNSRGIMHSKYQNSFPQRFHEAFGNELGTFANVITGRIPQWPITKDDCIRVQKVADAAKESAQSGNVVHL